jgi:hypothetical protein
MPMRIPAATNDEQSLRTAEAMRQLYGRLEDVLKRHRPEEYASVITQCLRKYRDSHSVPPHWALHSIEASCAYARGHNSDPVTIDRVRRVLKVYADHVDPYLAKLSEDGDADLFGLAMYREQMEIQYQWSEAELRRNEPLFDPETSIAKLAEEFHGCYGISTHSWIRCCMACAILVVHSDGSYVRREDLHRFGRPATPAEIDRFLELSSIDAKTLGESFRSKRIDTKPHLHGLVRSAFLKTPLLKINGDHYLAPLPPLIPRHSGHGLYHRMRPMASFQREFGPAFNRCVHDVAERWPGRLRVVPEKEVEKRATERSCDLIIELPDCVLAVECKATVVSADYTTLRALQGDNSTTKILEANVQLYSTAHDIRCGRYDDMGVSNVKPIVGIVVTWDTIPFANSDWYRTSILRTEDQPSLVPPIFPSDGMTRKPIVMSLTTFEALVKCLDSTPVTMLGLCGEWESVPFLTAGDWDCFLANKLNRQSDGPDGIRSAHKKTRP